MSVWLIRLALVSLGVLLHGAVSGADGPGSGPLEQVAPPKVPGFLVPKQSFGGKVVGVAANSFTLQSFDMAVAGSEKIVSDGMKSIHTGKKVTLVKTVDQISKDIAQGTKVFESLDTIVVSDDNGVVATFRLTDMVPKTFHATAKHKDGAMPHDAKGANSYRLTDVKIGDIVFVAAWKVNGRWEIQTFEILRRPGGKVPREHRPFDPEHPWSEYAQAYQDYEEKGAPIPEHLRPKKNPPRLK